MLGARRRLCYGAGVGRGGRNPSFASLSLVALVATCSASGRAQSPSGVDGVEQGPASRSAQFAETPLYADPVPDDVSARYVGRTARFHDGWYFRFALGWGGLRVHRIAKADSKVSGSEVLATDSAAFASGVAIDVALGGTPLPGASLAGWVSVSSLSNPETRELVLVGALFDYFPRETGGLHFGVGLGLAEAAGKTVGDEIQSIESINSAIGVGVGFSPRVGYEFWIANQWALGAEFRGTFAFVDKNQTFDVGGLEVRTDEVSRLTGGALLLSLLHH